MSNYTELEKEIMETIVDIHDDGITCVEPYTIEHYSGMDMKKMRGALSSLVKKGVIAIDKYEGEVLISVYDSELRERCQLEVFA